MPDRLAQLKKLLEADPQDADLLYMIALEHAKTLDHTEALAWLDRTLERDASYLYAYFQKARALGELGRNDEAKRVLELGIQHAREAGNEKALSELSELLTTL